MSSDDKGKGVRLDVGSGKARKTFPIRELATSLSSGNGNITSGNTGSDKTSLSRSQPPSNVGRKTIPVDSTKRPDSSSGSQVAASGSATVSVTAKSAAQVSAKRAVNTTTKSTESRAWASKSTGSATKVIDAAPRASLIAGRSYEASQSTPSRVRFQVLRKSPTGSNQHRSSFPISTKTARPSPLGQPTRISSQNSTPGSQSFRRHSMNPLSSASRTPDIITAKSYKSLPPLWQQLDSEYEDRMHLFHKRDRDGNMVGLVKRISSSTGQRTPAKSADVFRLDADDPNHVGAQLGPKLKLKIPGEITDSDDDGPRYRPQARLVNRKVPGPQIALKKAARKLESVDTSSEESNDEDQNMSPSSEKGTNKSDLEPMSPAKDVTMQDVSREVDPPKIFLLDTPPTITAPLPEVNTATDDANQPEPATELVSAVEALTLSTIRLQRTAQLPFLLRNLREGFLKRCRRLMVPIYRNDGEISLQVYYEHPGSTAYQAEVSDWQCPLCDLLGILQTREMLDCHLKWDHAEVYHEWHEVADDGDTDSWKLQLLIPEAPELNFESTLPIDQTDLPFSSPFRSLSLSPPSTQGRHGVRGSPPLHTSKIEPSEEMVLKLEPQPSVTPSRRSTTLTSTWRSQSATATVTSISTSTTVRPPRSPTSRYPTPPPQDNPLGPAAKYPYLPAKSDHGGPEVCYSSRPGGPCLFDLLGTLPMEQFGLLDWEVLDREDEIYESDDVREEYKVMHALWARWIILNRNKFIANYYKGMISFVDQYWRIIHKAAGWDALRYFLFIFLANQFLTGREVGQVLLHYEQHTGMESWYD